MRTKFKAGDKFEVRYPFVRTTAYVPGEDGEIEMDGWRPGCEAQDGGRGEMPMIEWFAHAHAHGQMLLEVVSTHKPGKFLDRIFYVRHWRDPDGKEFGKNNLRVATASSFGRLLKGYRHDYECDDEEEAA